MICKQCGTETKEHFCPRCGDLLDAQAFAEITVPAESVPTQAATRAYRRPPLRLKMVMWQALALLLPIAYFFFDAFVVLSDKLFLSSVSGNMNLARLMERLVNTLYASNTVSEVAEATLGESVTLMESISLFSMLSGGAHSAVFWLPFAIMTFFVLLCVLSAFFLFFTGGRILRLRPFCNLVLFGGAGAVFAPLIASFALRLFYCAGYGMGSADVIMQRILPSFEHLCVMGILACALLPSLSSLKEISAYARRQNKFLTCPFGGLEARSFAFKKVLAFLACFAAISLIICYFCLPISTIGALSLSDAIPDAITCYHTLVSARNAVVAGNGACVDFLAIVHSLIRFAASLATAILLICCVALLVIILRLVTLRSAAAAQKKGAKRVLESAGRNVRNAVLAPYISFLVIQVVAVLLLLFSTPVVSHLNFSNIDQTLSVLYLIIAYVRTMGGTQTLYSIMAVGGMLLWHTVGKSADALVITEKMGKKARK